MRERGWPEAATQKKLTITIDERVYNGLRAVGGRRPMSQFVHSSVRPLAIGRNLELAYQRRTQEEAHEAEALHWAEAAARDVVDKAGTFLGRRQEP
jgi:hypothetical protein